MAAVQRLAHVHTHVCAGRPSSNGGDGDDDPPPRQAPRDHTPSELQVVARRLGVQYGPLSFVRPQRSGEPIGWIGDRSGRGVSTEDKALELIERMVGALRETDVWIATYPKCGTSWTHQIALVGAVAAGLLPCYSQFSR